MYIMICEEILKRLEVEYPPSCAEEWDNPGLLVGRRSGEVRRIFVALDVTDETLEDACSWGADLMVTHHPLIFGSIRQVAYFHFLSDEIAWVRHSTYSPIQWLHLAILYGSYDLRNIHSAIREILVFGLDDHCGDNGKVVFPL